MRKTAALLFAIFLASSLSAQQVIVGKLAPKWNYGFTRGNGNAAPFSYIDFAHPATADGTVNRVTVMWGGGCVGAFKVVFLRTTSTDAAFVVAQRGPFDTTINGPNIVTLNPPVSVHAGDKLAIVQVRPGFGCGMPPLVTDPSGLLLITTTDISSGSFGFSPFVDVGESIGAIAYTVDPVLVRVLPAAGATQGVTAFFRTGVQLANPGYSKITGKLVYHKAGQSAGSGDPALDFSINPGQVLSYSDVVASMGSSGLGSLDVLVSGGISPVVTARVFADGGSAGTSGFTEDGLAPQDALGAMDAGCLLLPGDLINFRMNVGVRTLDAGATLKLSWNGGASPFLTLTYPPNYFEQKTVSQFTGVATPPANGCLCVKVDAGSAFVYGTITDNRTSDSSMRMAKAE